MRKITYRQALQESLNECLESNANVILLGEDVGKYGGAYAISKGLIEKFGEERIIDTPLSEAAFTGIGIGAAIFGLRPIVEIMTVNFALLALDQIINNAATLNHMSGGQIELPVIIRITTGATRQLAAQHSHDFSGWFAHIVGIRVLSAATVMDARYMLIETLKSKIPTIIFEQGSLHNDSGEIQEINSYEIEKAKVVLPGKDISIITFGSSLKKCLNVAEIFEQKNISIEVIDLRSLRPIDEQTIFKSIRKTHKALIVEEGWRSGSISAEICSRIQENVFYELDKPILRVCSIEIPLPYNKKLEQQCLPNEYRISNAVEELIREY